MNSATLSTRPGSAVGPSGQSHLRQFWEATLVTFGVVFNARHQLQQFDEMRRLLREAHRCETSNAVRSAALREKAFALID